MLKKIVSGLQSGSDRAGADVAIKYGLEQSGFVPKGRRAEDGLIPQKYNAIETKTSDYQTRTELNVTAADATFIFKSGVMGPGSKLTVRICDDHKKKYLVLDVYSVPELIADWLKSNNVETLNIAGSRESTRPGIYKATYNLLDSILEKYFN